MRIIPEIFSAITNNRPPRFALPMSQTMSVLRLTMIAFRENNHIFQQNHDHPFGKKPRCHPLNPHQNPQNATPNPISTSAIAFAPTPVPMPSSAFR